MASSPKDKNVSKTEKLVNLDITKENMSPTTTKNVSCTVCNITFEWLLSILKNLAPIGRNSY